MAIKQGVSITFGALAIMGGACAQGTASGTLTLNKDTFQLKYAAAMRVPDSFDKTKMATRIVLTDKAFPAKWSRKSPRYGI